MERWLTMDTGYRDQCPAFRHVRLRGRVAVSHVVNRRFIAPVYDVVANIAAFACAVAASVLLRNWTPALLSSVAILCWLVLARRTILARQR